MFKYYETDSILVINKAGDLKRLQCPFDVIVIQDVGELCEGSKCLVSAIIIDLSLIDIYNQRQSLLLL